MDADVLVIGAGLAGLTAARDLRETGRRVIVDRGSRPDRWADLDQDAAGHGRHRRVRRDVGRARRSARHRGRDRPVWPGDGDDAQPQSRAWVVGGRLRDGPDVRQAMATAVDALEEPLASLARRFADARRSGDPRELAAIDIPVTTWLGEVDVPVEAAEILLSYSAAMGGGPPERISAIGMLSDLAESGFRIDEGWSNVGDMFVDGTQSLVAALAAGSDIRLHHVVQRIEAEDGGATAVLEGGQRVTASGVVVAVPLNVWSHIGFSAAARRREGSRRGRGTPGRLDQVAGARHRHPDPACRRSAGGRRSRRFERSARRAIVSW